MSVALYADRVYGRFPRDMTAAFFRTFQNLDHQTVVKPETLTYNRSTMFRPKEAFSMLQENRNWGIGMVWGTLLSLPLWMALIGWYQILTG